METSTLTKYIPVFRPSGRFAVQIRSGRICHCCIIDGLFSSEDETVRFDEATLNTEAISNVQAAVRERVLRLFKRRGLLSPEAVDAMRAGRDMKAAAHDAHPCASPFGRLSAVQIGYPADLSLNADVMVAARDRAGLERLLRYCARPVFASERLPWIEMDRRLVYRLPKPKPDGQTVLCLSHPWSSGR